MSSSLRAFSSGSSPTHGAQLLNQKLTTVTEFSAKISLLTEPPSRSLPVNAGKLCMSEPALPLLALLPQHALFFEQVLQEVSMSMSDRSNIVGRVFFIIYRSFLLFAKSSNNVVS